MPEISSYTQGTPSWIDLATSDVQGAVHFYGALFGWKDNPADMGNGEFYHMQELKGQSVGAIRKLGEEEAQHGVPPHWQTYIAVTNVDEAAERATAAGGTVLMPPMDVFDAGRMAMVQDPQGAVVALWQAQNHIGSTIANEPGSVIWSELMTTDSAKAAAFYSALLQVETGKFPGPMDYTTIKSDGRDVAGIMDISPEMGPLPPNWMSYFAVENVDASAEQATSLGGRVMVGPQDIPNVGRFAVIQDPQGAVFAIFQVPQGSSR